ncbi:polyprenol phosphomannose-dependent alpha 1,6 mannosyltransferase MptB [Parafrankia sp. FMc6]|uniref:polyprenol phosphomannose-dependent alpha 1,6 mannosyltransferase MptB n=1 Tax=Parafrankia soli TaxID=2599596 RepID=UPI0034D66035
MNVLPGHDWSRTVGLAAKDSRCGLSRLVLCLLAGLGVTGSALMAATAGRLALRPGVVAPSRWYGLLDPVPLDRPSLVPAVMLGGVALLAASWWGLCRHAARGSVSVRGVAAIVAAWAVPVILGPPILSLDVYSYTAQGVMLAAGLDPYTAGPVALGAHPAVLAVDPVWRSATAPYGPVALAFLRATTWLASGDLLRAVLIQRAVAVFGVAAIAVCVARIAPVDRRPWAVAACAGSPIVLLQLIGAVHLEALMMALGAAGLAAAARGRGVLGLVLTTTAALVKWPAVLIVVVMVAGRTITAMDTAGVPGPRAAPIRRRAVVGAVAAGRDLTVVATTTVLLSALVPHGFGWLHTVGTPSAGLTLYAPTTGLADLLSAMSGMDGSAVPFTDLLGLVRAAGVVAATGVFIWLLATIRDRDVPATAGLALLCLALLGPVLYPWYFAWGLVPLAMAEDTRRRRFTAVTVVGSFLALPHCELLFVNHPQVAPWLARQGPLILVIALICATAASVARHRRSFADAG